MAGGKAWAGGSGAYGFTFSVTDGDDVQVRGEDAGATRDAWLPVLQQVETVLDCQQRHKTVWGM